MLESSNEKGVLAVWLVTPIALGIASILHRNIRITAFLKERFGNVVILQS